MSQQTHSSGFDLDVSDSSIAIGRGTGKIILAPAEAEKITTLLSMVLSLGSGAAGRDVLQSSPFRILIDNQGKDLTLIRKGMRQGEGLCFRTNDIDRLVSAINAAIGIYRDVKILRGGPSPAAAIAGASVPEPPFEGRE